MCQSVAETIEVDLDNAFRTKFERHFELIEVYPSKLGLDLPDETFLLSSPALKEILFDRSLVGRDLQTQAYYASRFFFEALKHNGLISKEEISHSFEQVNLAGSLYYSLPSAFGKVFDENFPQNLIAISRKKIDGEFDEKGIQKFETILGYKRFEAHGKLCIMGETIATSRSACDSLEEHLPYAIKHGLQRMIIFSICGSKIGAERTYQVFKKYDIPVMFVFGLALFGLGKDGTALMWVSDNEDKTYSKPKFLKMAETIFSPGECAIGDWGGRFTAPEKALGEWYEGLKRIGHPEKFRVPDKYKAYFPGLGINLRRSKEVYEESIRLLKEM